MTLANQKIREVARANRIPLWRIASELGVSEPTMTRWLRIPLSQEREEQVKAAINRLAKAVN